MLEVPSVAVKRSAKELLVFPALRRGKTHDNSFPTLCGLWPGREPDTRLEMMVFPVRACIYLQRAQGLTPSSITFTNSFLSIFMVLGDEPHKDRVKK